MTFESTEEHNETPNEYPLFQSKDDLATFSSTSVPSEYGLSNLP